MKNLIIIGNGQLAAEYRGAINSNAEYHIIEWESRDTTDIYAIIHAGSGRQYIEVCKYAKIHSIPFIQCATHEPLPVDIDMNDIVYVDAPNTNTVILDFISGLRYLKKRLKNPKVIITESHQKDKKTLPGTAIEIGKIFDIPSDLIISIRDIDIQTTALGIPEQYLQKHAYHRIDIVESGTTLKFESLVLGLNGYGEGLVQLLGKISGLESRKYSITELF